MWNSCLDKCKALAKAEEAVVGDWEADFINRYTYVKNVHGDLDDVYNRTFHGTQSDVNSVKTFITNLLAAKDREIVEAYKKGFIDGLNSYGTNTTLGALTK